jgi:hypothetical protein
VVVGEDDGAAFGIGANLVLKAFGERLFMEFLSKLVQVVNGPVDSFLVAFSHVYSSSLCGHFTW